MRQLTKQRGDTLVEVLLAISILAVAITVTYTIMTRMFAVGMLSLERSQTQALLNGQAALIRDAQGRSKSTVANSAYDWSNIKTFSKSVATPNADGCSGTTGGSMTSPTTSWYFLDTTQPVGTMVHNGSSKITGGVPLAAPTPGKGMWAETVKYATPSSGQTYYDIYIKACWDSPYSSVRQQMKTIVRLYDTP